VREKIVRLRLGFAKAVVIGALGVAAVGLVAAPASAGGTSTTIEGCYGKWWNTAFAGYCEPAAKTGYFQLFAYCDYESDIYIQWQYISKGSYVAPFSAASCTYHVTYAAVGYHS
jgi:hypothetical protein